MNRAWCSSPSGASTDEDGCQDVRVGFRHETLSMRSFTFTPQA
jgi:hypothetical protein